MAPRNFLEIAALFSGTSMLLTVFTVFVGNIIFGEVFDKYKLATGINDAHSIAYLLSLLFVVLIITVLIVISYFLLRGQVISDYVESDSSGVVNRLGQEISNMRGEISKLQTVQSEYTTGRLAQLSGELANLSHEVRARVTEIDKTVNSALNSINAIHLVSNPNEYGRILIDKAKDESAAKTLSLVGTMAGFNFTVGLALPRYIFDVENFTSLNIFTTARKDGDGHVDTILYSTFLIISTIREFIRLCNEGPSRRRSLTIKVGYMNRDLFSAAIMIPEHECIVMPTLKSTALKAILDDGGMPLLGLRYRANDPRSAAIFSRYEEVIEGHRRRYLEGGGTAAAATGNHAPECWSVEVSAEGNCKITVSSPRWSINNGNYISDEGLSTAPPAKPVVLSDGAAREAVERLALCVRAVLSSPGAGIDFGVLLGRAKGAGRKLEYAFEAQ